MPRASVSGDAVLHALVRALRAAAQRSKPPSSLYLEHLTLAIRAHLNSKRAPTPTASSARLTTLQQRRLRGLVESRLNGPIKLEELAAACGISSGHFSRVFKQTTGQTPHQWLLDLRVEHAKRLLRGKRSLTDVAGACGFADLSHFIRVFTQRTGKAPGAWRRSIP